MATTAAVWTTGQKPAPAQQWQQEELRVEGYGRGVRRAVVLLRGTELCFWAGHYGAKFSAPSLRFVKPALSLTAGSGSA